MAINAQDWKQAQHPGHPGGRQGEKTSRGFSEDNLSVSSRYSSSDGTRKKPDGSKSQKTKTKSGKSKMKSEGGLSKVLVGIVEKAKENSERGKRRQDRGQKSRFAQIESGGTTGRNLVAKPVMKATIGSEMSDNENSLDRFVKKRSDGSLVRSKSIKKKAATQQELDSIQAQEPRASRMRENKKTVFKSTTNLDGVRRDGLKPMPSNFAIATNLLIGANQDDGRRAVL